MNGKKPWDFGALRPAAGRPYLVNGDKPFFWLGDTAWLMLHRLTLEQADLYLRNRAEKGFTVIQATILHHAPGTNVYGQNPFVDLDISKPDMESGYWDYLDKVVRIAANYGIYMGLLPHWGVFGRKGDYSLDQAEAYAEFLAKRYADAPNVIWIVGGDTRGSDAFAYWTRMGQTLRRLNPDKLITFHPFGRTTSIDYFPDGDWLDMHMFQSGHRRYDQVQLKAWDDNDRDGYSFGEDNWRYVERVHRLTAGRPNGPMPVLDGEPSYENIPQGLHSGAEPCWRDQDVRRYAWWSVLAGACGFTYGHNAIMQFWATNDRMGNFACWETWMEAIHHPGSDSVGHLAGLMRSLDFTAGHPSQELLAEPEGERYERISVFAGPDYLVAYSYTGRPVSLKAGAMEGDLEMYWMNPMTGVMSYAGPVDFTEARTLRTPSRQYMPNSDWALIIRKKEV
ncbi:MAG: DUF4038 domain-containing protein [Firmicutes bacterium]|nr:DUF4038 domain-containing protein [Bacillota bacterium]